MSVVVIITPTIMDGTVVRWYASEIEAEQGREFVSASRNGVLVSGYLNLVPQKVLDAALDAHEVLDRRRGADLTELATHRKIYGRLERIGAQE